MRTRLLLVVIAACATTDRAPSSPSPTGLPPPPAAALYAATEPAPSGALLRVFVEPTRLVGWVAGSRSFAGSIARVELAGKTYGIPIDGDNTFALPYEIARRSEATVRVGSLVQVVTVEPPVALEPTAFFVVDRPAYRPGQKLSFAGFLRRLDGDGAQPIARAPVTVRIVSETKQTTAATLALVSDDAGRIAGDYTFSTGDPLDTYAISIAGYRGTARVTLGEYRKSKVKLDVVATVGPRAARLAFRALDFLDAPVPGGHVTFEAQIVRDPAIAAAPPALDPSRFVLATAHRPLRADEQLMLAAYPDHAGWSPDRGTQVIDQVAGTVVLDGKGEGSYEIPIASELVRGRHRLLVDAVIVDANGREQRTTKAISLARGDVRVELATADRLVGAGHPIDVAVAVVDANGRAVTPASASIAAMRIDPPQGLVFVDHRYGGWNGNDAYFDLDNGSARSCRYTAMGCRTWPRATPRPAAVDPVDKLAAAVAVTDRAARVVLDDPGAYRLVASVRLADGTTAWSELAVAVRDRDALPPLVVDLDADEIGQGDRITGRIQSRYRDAAALVVVRDARGIHAQRRVVLVGGRARFDLPAGDRLGHGALVEAFALVDNDQIYAAQDHLRVAPTEQVLAITTDPKPSYRPGETVDLDIAVATREPVDLVVAVYDQSLLGVAPDHAVDPRDFYLADDRVRSRAAISALVAELGDLTVGNIITRAKAIAKRPIPDDADPEARAERDRAAALVAWVDNRPALDVRAVIELLRHAGVRAAATTQSGWSFAIADRKALRAMRLVDLVARDMRELAFELVADAIVIADPRQPTLQLAGLPIVHRGYSRGDASGNASYSASGNASFAIPEPLPIEVGGDTTDVVRRDFSDSAYWSATARTDAAGKARVSFRLPDSLTNWQVVVIAVARDLRVGRHVAQLRSLRDVMIWPMLPRQFTEGDVVSIFSTVHNLTAATRDMTVRLDARHVDVLTPATVTVRVPSGKSVPVTWSVRARGEGVAELVMSATSATGADASLKRIPIVASAADQVVTASGFADRPLVVELPAGVDPSRATLELSFAPSLAADMIDTIGYLVEYQYGCAEQTMSRFAPAIRVAGILDNLGIEHGDLRKRLPGVVSSSLKRLVELQQPDGGWGWHGTGSTHEMITPYVVWGLIEAEKAGYDVPGNRVIERGLERIHAFLAGLSGDDHLADRAYLMYVAAQRDRLPDRMWKELVDKRDALSDYALALALEIAVARKDTANAGGFAERLRDRAVRAGGGASWRTARFSRWGDDPFETSAAALKALVAHDASDPLIAESVAYFVATKRGDRWNSTKDTAMILYAITDLLARRRVASATGGAYVDYALDGGAPVHLALSDGAARKVVVPGAKLGKRTTIAFAAASPGLMARAVLRFRKSGRDLAPAASGLVVERRLYLLDAKGARARPLASGDRVPRGAYVESAVTVTHAANEAMRFLLIEDPKPAGAEALPVDDPRFPRVDTPWVLREDRETHLAFHHEQVPPTTTARTYLHLEMKGELVIPPAQAELMYQTSTRGHAGSFVLKVD